MINTMASAISTTMPSLLQSSTVPPSIGKKHSMLISAPKYAPQLGFASFPQWIISGRKQLGTISMPKFSARMRTKGKHRGTYASLFGVGAPEVLVVGIVALLVFGPKGLAEAARSLGKTIRSFQPTIKELQEVSREFKSSLQREIGLDEIDNPASNRFSSKTPKPTTSDAESRTSVERSDQSPQDSPASETRAYTADEYLKVTEAQLKGALDRLQKEKQDQIQPQTPSNETPKDGDGRQVPPKPKSDA